MPVYVDAQGIDAAIRELQRLSPRTRAAANTAIRKTVRWANVRASREIAKSSDVGVRNLRGGKGKRFFNRFPRSSGTVQEGSIWIGYNPIGASYVGAIPAWRRGLTPRVRSHKFPGDFVATMSNGKRSIFTRNVDSEVKRRKALNRRETRPFATNLWGLTSLPIDEQDVDLQQVDSIVRGVEVAAREHLKGVLAQELNYQLRVRKT